MAYLQHKQVDEYLNHKSKNRTILRNTSIFKL